MLVRFLVAPFIALPLLTLAPGCGPCEPKPGLSDQKCPGGTGSASESGDASATSSTASTETEPTTTDVTSPSGTGTMSEGSATTMTAVCGDGRLDPGEDCDDGNEYPGDGCEPNCTMMPFCGDGNLDPGEQCDDGNDENTDACVACTNAGCGDGYVQDRVEACDDGANNGSYGYCASGCGGLGPRCGDRIINGLEECDDGNQVDEDECSEDCFAPRLVFVTSERFNGDLREGPMGTGLKGADAKCAEAAGDLGRPEAQWRAWLSDGSESAEKRLNNKFTGYYKRLDGFVIAHGWGDLVDGSIQVPIRIDESGSAIESVFSAWTNTHPSGVADVAHCNDWAYGEADQPPVGLRGVIGNGDEVQGGEWTEKDVQACGSAFRLYCFED